jgi:murein DD-endopeptidase MepM/ murein hydrolase activator NlpD
MAHMGSRILSFRIHITRLKSQSGLKSLYLTLAILGLLITACGSEPSSTPTLAQKATVPAVAATITPRPTLTPEPSPTLLVASPAEEATATPASTPEPRMHTVQSGDTLLAIALDYGVDLDALIQFNNLDPAAYLAIGQVLQIPPIEPAPEDQDSAADTPSLPTYSVQAGDSWSSIAAQFASYGVTTESIQQANPNVGVLLPGTTILLPIAEGDVHYVLPGDQLLAIAIRYGVSLDDLVEANTDVLDPANIDLIYPGWLLRIPGAAAAEGYDCSPQPPRTEVIEYTVKNGERLYCLSRKFNLSMTTILHVNANRIVGDDALTDGVTILIPPTDGALYVINENDVTAETTLADLALWYGIQSFESITDWEGNPVQTPLSQGQQIFIRGADLLAGSYQSPVVVAYNADQAAVQAGGGTAGVPIPPPAGSDPSGVRPAGGLPPLGTPWLGDISSFDTGYCPAVAGSGWSGSLGWPVRGRTINDNRGFRPGHTAIDINAAVGEPTYAAAAGVVRWAGFSIQGFGNLVVLDHGGGYQTFYAHLSEVFVSCGQSVGQGAQIGQTGQTGASTWPHLHFEVRLNGYAVDPLRYLP